MEAPKEKQARKEFWLAHVNAWRESGLTQVAYCQQHHLKSPDMLSYWVNRAKVLNPPSLTLIPAHVIPPTTQSEELRLSSPSGWQLTLPGSLSAGWVAELLQQLS